MMGGVEFLVVDGNDWRCLCFVPGPSSSSGRWSARSPCKSLYMTVTLTAGHKKVTVTVGEVNRQVTQ